MTEPVAEILDSMRLLVDLQRVSELVQRLRGCLEPETIAKQTTDGLVEMFGCAFARIWLMEPNGITLKLVASSGMYTHTDGFFARVPVGAFKVGKIAQNRIPFLSNNLADEPWVKDRAWAIAHHIIGFAGYPLAIGEKVVGVVAVFSHQSLSSEFLEILQGLCTTLTVMVENSLQMQYRLQHHQSQPSNSSAIAPLSEQLAVILNSARLSLVGTERSLPASLTCILLRTVEVLRDLNCTYCRLSYGAEQISLEAMVIAPESSSPSLRNWVTSQFGNLLVGVVGLGGNLQTFTGANQNVMQIVLRIPYPKCSIASWLRIHLNSKILQYSFTHLAYQAGLNVCSMGNTDIPLITDDLTQIQTSNVVLWVDHSNQTQPQNIAGKVDLSIDAGQLRDAVEAIERGERWGLEPELDEPRQALSDREQEILGLLATGCRDRDIATQLHISERTVKFHINNILTKLKAKTRCQAMYQAIVEGWLRP